MATLGCKWHPSRDNVGVCALCLRESLSRLAAYQDEEDDSIDLEISPPSKPSRGPVAARRAQFILVQYDEDTNHGGMMGESSKSFYAGDGVRAMGAQGSDREPSYLSLYGNDHSGRQGELSTSDDSGSGGQAEAVPQSIPPMEETGELSRNKRKLRSSSGRQKSKSWGSAMLKLVGLRTMRVLWRSERKCEQASSSGTKPTEQGYAGGATPGAPVHDQQLTPGRISASSIMEQTTPARYSVSAWEQTPPAQYSVMSINDQITPARCSGASLFDIESMDSRRFSTSSRGSPFSRASASAHKPINGDNFNAAWRASKSAVNARRMGAFEGFGSGFHNELQPMGKPMQSSVSFATRDYRYEDGGQGRENTREAGQVKKSSSWKWFSPFRGAPLKEERRENASPFEKVTLEAPSDIGYQERRKSTSSIFGSRSRDHNPQTLTPKLSGKKSPWWRGSPHIRAQKSPLRISAKTESRDQEVAVSTDSDLMDDTPHRLSSASPLVGYSRSSSNGSSCFTTPRWKQRSHNGNRVLGVQETDREHEITHLAI